MDVHFRCPQGHRLHADRALMGRLAACPRCRTPVVVPGAEPEELTEAEIVRLLSAECAPQAQSTPAPPPPPQPTRPCSRCRAALSRQARVCPRCQLRQAPAEFDWKSVCRDALRSVRGNS